MNKDTFDFENEIPETENMKYSDLDLGLDFDLSFLDDVDESVLAEEPEVETPAAKKPEPVKKPAPAKKPAARKAAPSKPASENEEAAKTPVKRHLPRRLLLQRLMLLPLPRKRLPPGRLLLHRNLPLLPRSRRRDPVWAV